MPEGALFYATSRRRRIVAVDADLRAKTESTVKEVRQLLASGVLPPPLNNDHCRACSLRDLCQPQAVADSPERSLVLNTLFEPDD